MEEEKTEHIRLIDKKTRLEILDMPFEEYEKGPKRCSMIDKSFLLNFTPYISKRKIKFTSELGPGIWFDFKYSDRSYVEKALFMPFSMINRIIPRNKFCVLARREIFLWEKYVYSEKFRPLDLDEKILRDSDRPGRIDYLIENILEFVEERNQGNSKLYKDKKDGRYFQFINIDGLEKQLVLVNQTQWQYEYVEAKILNPQHFFYDDKEFYEGLIDDPRGIHCEEESCNKNKVKNSSLCRDHHFEAIRGEAYGNRLQK